MLKNFLYEVCACSEGLADVVVCKAAIDQIREKVGQRRVLWVSGGVDSSVAAVMVHKGNWQSLTCIFVDHGMLRKNGEMRLSRCSAGNSI